MKNIFFSSRLTTFRQVIKMLTEGCEPACCNDKTSAKTTDTWTFADYHFSRTITDWRVNTFF